MTTTNNNDNNAFPLRGVPKGSPFGTSIGYEKGEALFCRQSVTCLFLIFEIVEEAATSS